MPAPNKSKPYPLSKLNDARELVEVRCAYCKRAHVYYATDLMQLFGDVDVDSLAGRMTCESVTGGHGLLHVERIFSGSREMVGRKIRRLVAIQIKRVPIWKEE
ncbi:hypothetical protein GGQ99_001256 [Aminobacter niigataensis]|uniref:SelT/SelW/SelH family protein n=1 Tax=Aminobacter niigataensis TaxID=83265 RepID=A0ABR6KYC6_9HYPH|nr:hypothetical protein [Aminobacter niigataensis]MBB4649534.1 hypothetical protein [Aminobacter niigataensis]